MANQIQSSKCLSTVTTAKLPLYILHILQTSYLDSVKKSHTGDLHTGLSLGFGASGLESGTSSAKVIEPVDVVSSSAEVMVVSVEVTLSAEVTVEVVIAAFDDGGNGASIAEDKGEDI